jgi:phosphate-selective porin OprO/OprP
MKKKFTVMAILCGLLIVNNPVYADNTQLMQLFDILYKKGTLTQEEYQLLRNTAQEPKTKESVPFTEVKTTGGLKVTSPDGAYEFNLGGRIQADAGFWGDDRTDNASGTELRRARIDFSGKIERDWKFKLAYDFANNEVEDKSAYVAYDGWGGGTIKAGLYSPPFTLSDATGSLHSMFMEEPMIVSAFKPDDRISLGVESGGDNWSAQMAIFGEGPAANSVDDEANGVSARVTWAPIIDKTSLLHLGAGMVYQTPDSVNEGTTDRNGNGITGENVTTARFRSRPEAHVNMGRFVDTKAIYNVVYYNSYGLELAAMRGPLSFEGEYIATNISRNGGQPDLLMGGYYGSLGWFLTGESRTYKAKSGSFDRIKPLNNFDWKKGGTGAWEIATRYSTLDLTDENVVGGKEKNITFGVNWYLTPQLRIMTNYVMVNTDTNENPHLIQTRIQLDF